MKNCEHHEKRFEKKYLLPVASIEKLLLGLASEIAPLEHGIVENYYFDSPHLKAYEDSIGNMEIRSKLRLRQYEKNFENDLARLEFKEREGTTVIKERINVKKSWIFAYLENGDLPIREIFELNQSQSQAKTLKLLEKFDAKIKKEYLAPVIKTSYHRVSYVGRNIDGLRITVDQSLKYHSIKSDEQVFSPVLSPYAKRLQEGQNVLEIKSKTKAASDFIATQMAILGNPHKFSKYCSGIYYLFGQEDNIITPGAFNQARLEGEYLDYIRSSI